MQDHSVVLVSLGFLLNTASLLLSPADLISPLTGYQLVQTKVIPSLSHSLSSVLEEILIKPTVMTF